MGGRCYFFKRKLSSARAHAQTCANAAPSADAQRRNAFSSGRVSFLLLQTTVFLLKLEGNEGMNNSVSFDLIFFSIIIRRFAISTRVAP